MARIFALIQKIKELFFTSYDYVYVLDFGNYSLRWALVRVRRDTGERQIEQFEQSSYWYDEHIETGSSYLVHALTACKKQIEELRPPRKLRGHAELIIGLSLDGAHGYSSTIIHKRENPEERVSEGELTNILQGAQLRAYEEMRRVFSKDSGLPDTDIEIANSVVQEVRMDNRIVEDPFLATGKEIRLDLFNCYFPAAYRTAFTDIAKALGLAKARIVYTPYAVLSVLRAHDASQEDALIINIGGRSTRVSLMRKGKMESGRSFAFGGEAFTKRVASELKLSARAAENVKVQYSRGDVGENVRRAIEIMFEPEVKIFLDALEMILKEFVSVSLLPGALYLYGGGSALPVFDAIMKKRKWKQELSFFGTPKIRYLEQDMFRTVLPEGVPFGTYAVSLLALCDYAVSSAPQQEQPLARILSRVTKLIAD
ncbi:MAG: hypothetical protein WDZ44_00940 [Candidatus Spechtbacterales bacterium]